MVEYFNEHEQGDAVKSWLKQNGGAIIMGLVIAFGGLFGFKQWASWQDNQRQRASAEFEVMSQLLSEDQLDSAMSNYQTLKDDYADSPYASLAALEMARARLEAGQVDLAMNLYRFVAENGTPAAIRLVGVERLARVLLDQESPAEALALIEAHRQSSGFEATLAEVQGDIFAYMGNNDEAITSYQAALDALEEGVGDRNFLELKLKSVGGVPQEQAEAEDGTQS